MQRQTKAIFVTGADAAFYRCTLQLLLAVARNGWQRGMRWIVYDMGLEPWQAEDLCARFDWMELRKLDLDRLPPHYVPSRGTYAFKGHVMWQVVESANEPVIWMDSANLPLGTPDGIIEHVRVHGFYILRGQASLHQRCDPRVLEQLDVPRWVWGTREIVSCVVGIDAGNKTMRDIARRWSECSAIPEIIRPEGCIDRHMNDQAVLGAITLERVCTGEITLPEEDIDISSGRPVRQFSTRNKVGSDLPLWLDPAARAYYRVGKVLDQFVHRLRGYRTSHDPFLRYRSEAGRIFCRGPDGVEQALRAPPGHVYSDPCMVEVKGQTWVLFRDLTLWNGRSRISAMRLGCGSGKAIRAIDTLVDSFSSFWRDGQLWIAIAAGGRLELFECTSFPGEWRPAGRMLEDINAYRPAVFEHDGQWWLLVAQASPWHGESNRYLALYSSPDPVSEVWQTHPVNAYALEIQETPGSGENAGGVFKIDGTLIRHARHNGPDAERRVAFRKMTLTGKHFEEAWLPPPPDLEGILNRRARHVSRLGKWVAWVQPA